LEVQSLSPGKEEKLTLPIIKIIIKGVSIFFPSIQFIKAKLLNSTKKKEAKLLKFHVLNGFIFKYFNLSHHLLALKFCNQTMGFYMSHILIKKSFSLVTSLPLYAIYMSMSIIFMDLWGNFFPSNCF
jgi:hypothetical protein